MADEPEGERCCWDSRVSAAFAAAAVTDSMEGGACPRKRPVARLKLSCRTGLTPGLLSHALASRERGWGGWGDERGVDEARRRQRDKGAKGYTRGRASAPLGKVGIPGLHEFLDVEGLVRRRGREGEELVEQREVLDLVQEKSDHALRQRDNHCGRGGEDGGERPRRGNSGKATRGSARKVDQQTVNEGGGGGGKGRLVPRSHSRDSDARLRSSGATKVGVKVPSVRRFHSPGAACEQRERQRLGEGAGR